MCERPHSDRHAHALESGPPDDQVVRHCTRFTYVSSHLCDYGRQCALIAAIVLKENGGRVLDTSVSLHGSQMPVVIRTNGEQRVIENMPGQFFTLQIQGGHNVLEVEFYVNWQSVHRIFRLEAQFAVDCQDYFLPRETLANLEHLCFAGDEDELQRILANPYVAQPDAYAPPMSEMQQLETMLRELELIMMVEMLSSDPERFMREFGPEAALDLLMQAL